MNSSKSSGLPAVGDSPTHCEVRILPPRWQNPHLTKNPCELPQAVRSQEKSRDLRIKITNRSLTRTSIEAMISLKSDSKKVVKNHVALDEATKVTSSSKTWLLHVSTHRLST